VWRIPLNSLYNSLNECRAILCTDEEQRARRFRFERARKRFIATHAATRRVLAEYLECDPTRLIFEYGANGKPRIRQSDNAMDLEFNLSQSGDYALLAVASKLSLGIDVEAVTSAFATQEIANLFFSPDEVKSLLALPKEQRAEAFFCCWTRKEAYIKAKGGGLSIRLDSFSVTLHPDMRAALLRAADEPNGPNRWSIYDIQIDPNYKAALVVEGEGHTIFQFDLVPAHLDRLNKSIGTLIFMPQDPVAQPS
jgi:4'-phosphopantetheinyl transferase